MLSRLCLSNIATVSDTVIDFSEGLNVLTGETGAGKSILVDGLLLALGARGDRGLVRPGTEVASVEALFETPDGELLLRREVHARGRSRMFLDDALVTLDEVRNRVSGLLDLHTQRSSPALLRRKYQQMALDQLAGSSELASRVGLLFSEVGSLRERARRLRSRLDSLADERELLVHELSLLDGLSPERDDYEGLVSERRELRATIRAAERLGAALEAISGDDGLMDGLSSVRASLEAEGTGKVRELLEEASIALSEASSACSGLLSGMEDMTWRLSEVDGRLDSYSELMTRCGGTIEELLERSDRLRSELSAMEAMERELSDISGRLPEKEAELAEAASALGSARETGAEELSRLTDAELRSLGMPEGRLGVRMGAPPEGRSIVVRGTMVCSDGVELPELVFTANPGMEPGPLASIASGGELSRVSLALKLALSTVRQPPTVVFDEIDAGVGGRTARDLALSLARAGRSRQVIVITHLAWIAAMAGRHVAVSKTGGGEGEVPVTVTVALETEEGRTGELARLLGGGEAAGRHASRMLAEAGSIALGRDGSP